MHHYMAFLLTSVCLMLSNSAYAHNSPFAHPETSLAFVHAGMHLLLWLPLLTLAFFLGRWLIRTRTQRTPLDHWTPR